MQKRLSIASDLAVESENNAARFKTLASDIEKSDIRGGLFGGKWAEAYKDAVGSQDAVSSLRKRYNGVKGSLAVSNLPPGAASDADIKLALASFPTDNATKEEISQFLRGMAKIEQETARFNNFKSEFISDHGAERTKGGKSMLSQWKKLRREEEAAQKSAAIDKEAEDLAARKRAAEQGSPAGKVEPPNPKFEGVSDAELLNIGFGGRNTQHNNGFSQPIRQLIRGSNGYFQRGSTSRALS